MSRLRFVVQEEGEVTKELKFAGEYNVKDLEKIFLSLVDSADEWFSFRSQPNGFIIRKKNIKSVFLEESDQ
jgi:hypothetical protein